MRNIRRRLRWLVAGFLALSLTPAYAGDWTPTDTAYEMGYLVLHVIEWGQTLDIASNPGFKEDNPLLPRHPSKAQVNQYFALTGALHVGVAYALPPKARRWFQYITIGVGAADGRR